MKFPKITFTIIAVTVVLSSCGGNGEKEKESVYVNVCEVMNADQLGTHSFTGKTKAAEEANLSFRVSGQLYRILVNEGDKIVKGQVIAEMDNRDYQVQFNATEAEYQQIKADAERVIALYKEGNTTAQNYDKARYGLEQITQKLAHHRNQLEDTKLKSPISGYVKEKYHEAGETVAAGMPVLSVSGGDGIEVEINMSAADYARRDKFASFYCQFDILRGERYPLELVRIGNEANVSQLYTARLRFKGGYDTKRITPGMITMVYTSIEDEDNGVVIVPTSSILCKNSNTYVFIYDETSGTVKIHEVDVISLNRDGSTNVRGIRKGLTVVSTGVHHLSDGDKVKPIKNASKTNVGGLL